MKNAITKAIFRPVRGFEGIYEVSSTGSVYRCDSPRPLSLKAQPNSKGYLRVFLYNGKQKERRTVHHIVAEAFVPNPKKLPHVNHKDGKKKNNHYKNLEWCDVYQNNAHAKANGLYKPNKGSKHGMSRLTEEVVKELRSRDFLDYTKVAKELGISPSTIRRAVIKETWKHI